MVPVSKKELDSDVKMGYQKLVEDDDDDSVKESTGKSAAGMEATTINESSPLLLRKPRALSEAQAMPQVRGVKGLLRTLTESIRSTARSSSTSVGGAIKEELQNVKTAFREHVREADQGRDFFLDMGLTKNLSILPIKSDLRAAAEGFSSLARTLTLMPTTRSRKDDSSEAISLHQVEDGKLAPSDAADTTSALTLMSGEDSETSPSKATTSAHQSTKGGGAPLYAYFTLASAVAALSSIGPFLNLLDGVSPELKIVWRTAGTAIVLAPMAIQSVLVNGFPHLTYAQWCTMALASFSYSVLCVAFAMSLNYISVDNGTILTNSQSVLLVFAKLVTGSPVVFLEGLGVVVAFSGAVLSSRDPSATSMQQDSSSNMGLLSLWGFALGIISSIGGIGYIMLGKSLRSSMEVYVFMFLNMTVTSTMIIIYMVLTGEDISFDRDIDHGLWGWMHLRPDRLPVEIATVVVCNLMGTMGYVRAFKYFNSVIIAVAALMEPVTATFIAVALNVGVFPGVIGWIGNIMVILGTLAVIYPSIDGGG